MKLYQNIYYYYIWYSLKFIKKSDMIHENFLKSEILKFRNLSIILLNINLIVTAIM